ncbi:MAG: DegV family protein [Lachnospiraceae bacterium]
MGFFSEIMNILQGKSGTLKERIFCTICILTGSMAFVALLDAMCGENWILVIVSLGLWISNMILDLILVIKYNRITAASVIFGLMLCFVLLPELYIYGGGIHGVVPIWLTVNIVYGFLMFERMRRIFFLIANIIVYLFCFGWECYHPDFVQQHATNLSLFFDSVFLVVMIGVETGIILQIYYKSYMRQSAMIEEQNEKLERAGDSKNHFFASMSHELRTPINTIIGFNEMILREHTEGPTREYAENVENASKMLLSLVNDILDISQMELHKMEIVEYPYDLRELLRNVVNMINIHIKEKKLQLQLDIDAQIPRYLIGDKKRIQQILINLLTNGVKYTSSGTITLGVKAEEQKEEGLILKLIVRDTGIGIRKENLDSLYESFKRVDVVQNESIQGSGLGLTITKQLVDLMHGEISVDSIYSKGSTFTVLLPQKSQGDTTLGTMEDIFAGEDGEKRVYHQSFEAPEARILVVDDNGMNLRVIKNLLSSTGVQVDLALSGEDCLEKTSQRYYHVILLDHQMPGMDGVETLAKIQGQENGLCRDSVVIALTANAGSGAGSYYKDMGFDDYLEKPIDSRLLEKYILGYLPDEIVEYTQTDIKSSGLDLDIKGVKHKKKRKVVITTDCVAEIPAEDIKKYGIGVMYLYIRTEKGRFADTREINSDNLSQYLTDDSTTAYADSVSVEEYEDFFAKQLDQAERVIHISMASNSGKSYSVAKAAAQGFDHVHIVDAQQIACGERMQVLHAAKLAYNGCGAAEIIKQIVDYRDHVESCFIMPSAKIFYQCGYTTKLIATLCDVLHLHPILKMRKSRISVVGFSVGPMQLARVRFIRKQLIFKRRISKESVYISHVGLNVKQQQIVKSEIIRQIPFEQVYMEKAAFSCACTTGMGTFGFAYYIK